MEGQGSPSLCHTRAPSLSRQCLCAYEPLICLAPLPTPSWTHTNTRPRRCLSPFLQTRAISLKAVPMSLVMEGGSGKSYVMNLMDTPGE